MLWLCAKSYRLVDPPVWSAMPVTVHLYAALFYGLADAAAADDMDALLFSSSQGLVRFVQIILEEFPGRFDINGTRMSGDTALHLAAKNGHSPTVTMLLAHKAQKTKKNLFGRIPWDVAADDPALKALLYDTHGRLIIEGKADRR
jgi:ankyrin repeat protein